jgi:signal transduction histidine kinase
MQCVLDTLPMSVGVVSPELEVLCGNQRLRDLVERMKGSVGGVTRHLREAAVTRRAVRVTVANEAGFGRLPVYIYPLADRDQLVVMSGEMDMNSQSSSDECSTLDLCDLPVIAYDDAGDILFANTQACELTGFSRHILMNLPVAAICEDLRISTADARDCDVIIRLASGQTSPVRARIKPFRSHGRSGFSLTINGPVASDAERMAPLQRVAGMVAHKVNNLLTVIISYAELMSAQYSTVRSVTQDVGEIQAAASAVSGIMDKLLSFSHGKPSSPESILLDEWIESLRPVLDAAAGSIPIEIAAAAPRAKVLVPERELQSVLLAIVQNATDAIGGDAGLIRISTKRIPPQMGRTPGGGRFESTNQSYVLISVTDTGAGIDPALGLRVFEPFFTTRSGASGLGLSVAYGIVTKAGGRIAIAPESGGGTTVQLMLPEADMDRAEHSLERSLL